MTRLKNCPFCNSKATLLESACDSDYPTIHYVSCDNLECRCRTDRFDYESEAVETWNKRPESDLEKIIKSIKGG